MIEPRKPAQCVIDMYNITDPTKQEAVRLWAEMSEKWHRSHGKEPPKHEMIEMHNKVFSMLPDYHLYRDVMIVEVRTYIANNPTPRMLG